MSHSMLNQPLRYNTPNIIVSDNPIDRKILFSEALSPGKKTTPYSLVSPDLQFVHLVGAAHVADQVNHAGAEKKRKIKSGFRN